MKRTIAVLTLSLLCAGCGPSRADQELHDYYEQQYRRTQEHIDCLNLKIELRKAGYSLSAIKLRLEEHGFNLDCSAKEKP